MIFFLLLAGCVSASNVEQSAPTAALISALSTASLSTQTPATALAYPIVDTGQGKCYDNNSEVSCQQVGQAFLGQDAQYTGNVPHYQDNGNGTVTDLVTGLVWQQDPGAKMTYAQAVAGASTFKLAGYTDWRLPTIKELYSLILFDGTDSSSCMIGEQCAVIPFIDTRDFKFSYGDTSSGERIIDSQFATSTKYVSTTMNGNDTMFGVNFADGRIKGYGTGPMLGQSGNKTFYVLYARGNPNYGQNKFVNNGNATITDNATGLTWMQSDSGSGMTWESALAYCENSTVAGYHDWRLPNVKELQSIVDYSRSPATTNSAAIDPLFNATAITDEAGQPDYPFYWSSTTHADASGGGTEANYVAFGKALGYMNNQWMDVHGAGAQRSDPKTGSASEFPQGHGPQGDAVRVNNYVRCVRGGSVASTPNGDPNSTRPSMTVELTGIQQNGPGELNGQSGPQSGGGLMGPMGGTPPQAAISACSTSTQGETCEFNAPNGIINGICRQIQQQLACTPSNHP